MDEGALKVLRVKFIKLAMLLNIILFTAALAVIMYFKFDDISGQDPGLNLPVAVVFAVLTVALTLIFWRYYRAARTWLHEQPD